MIILGLLLLITSAWPGVARADLGSLSFSVTVSTPGGTVDFGTILPGEPVTRESAATFHVSSDLEWRLTASATALPGGYVLEERTHGGSTWTAIPTAPTAVRDSQPPGGPTDILEDFRITAGWDLEPGTYSLTVTYQASFTDQTGPVGTVAINGGAAYTASPTVTLNLEATDDSGVVDAVCFTNDDPTLVPEPAWSAWQDYNPADPTASWSLPAPDGGKSVWAKYRDRAGNESTPATASIILDTVFPTLSAIAVANITVSSADISWSSSEPVSGQVDYGLTAGYGQSSPLVSDPLLSHFFTLDGLAAGTNYHYRVRSSDPAGNTAVSDDSTFWTRCAAPLLTVTMTQTWGNRYNITLNWTPTTGATAYRVERKNTSDPVTAFAEVANPVTPSYIDANRTAPFSLDYRVFAVNGSAGTESDPSNVVTAAAGADTTPPIISEVAADPGQTTCAVTWTTNETATSAVAYRTGANPWTTTPVNANLVTDHSVNLSGLLAGTTYDYYVISTDEADNTSQSDIQQFTTESAPTPPPPPTNLRIGIRIGTLITIRWDQTPSATGYRLYSRDLLAPGGPGPWGLLTDQTGVWHYDGRYGSAGAQSYEYYVTAYNANGESGASNHLIVSE